MTQEQLSFITHVAQGKPENIVHQNAACPFCDVAHLTNILDREADRIWLVNKFRVLADSLQTIIIESSNHLGDWSNYDQSTAADIMNFSLRKWSELQRDPQYKSVIMYKNYGPRSGGSLAHPHMQIIGLDKVDGYAHVTPPNLGGETFLKLGEAQLAVANEPLLGFLEFNVRIPNIQAAGDLAQAVRVLTHYILMDYFHGRCDSYNLFFYNVQDGGIVCKVVPRFNASPLSMGYLVPQVFQADRIAEIGQEVTAHAHAYLG